MWLMIQAEMAVTLPPRMLDGGVRDLWERLVNGGRLPPICGYDPFAKEATVFWGSPPKGLFFVTGLDKTATGFTCQVSLHSDDVADVLAGSFFPIDLIERQLLCGRIQGWRCNKEMDAATFFADGDPEIEFTVSNIRRLYSEEDDE